jgi:hypothetical protein
LAAAFALRGTRTAPVTVTPASPAASRGSLALPAPAGSGPSCSLTDGQLGPRHLAALQGEYAPPGAEGCHEEEPAPPFGVGVDRLGHGLLAARRAARGRSPGAPHR